MPTATTRLESFSILIPGAPERTLQASEFIDWCATFHRTDHINRGLADIKILGPDRKRLRRVWIVVDPSPEYDVIDSILHKEETNFDLFLWGVGISMAGPTLCRNIAFYRQQDRAIVDAVGRLKAFHDTSSSKTSEEPTCPE
jgi:hypothetical protein